MKSISTTSLSKELGISSKDLFDTLVRLDLIYRKNDKWNLTTKGESVGGKITNSEKYGEFITWPENFRPSELPAVSKGEFLTATKLGEKFGVSNQRVNNILSELGWVEQAIKGWTITNAGKKIGGLQKEHQSGGTFVIWPESVVENKIFHRAIKPTEFLEVPKSEDNKSKIDKTEPKYPDTLLKSKDGHLVRSRAELIIDNLLYDYGITHAYERELTLEETVFSDFYIPPRNGKENKGKAVYIEFWGISDNDKYLERKRIKQEIYKKHNLNLIEVDDSHIDNLDIYLRKAFLRFDINIE